MPTVIRELTGTMQSLLKFGGHRIKSYLDYVALEERFGTAILEVSSLYLRVFGVEFSAGNTPPTLGTYNRGDIVWNKEATPEIAGWVCIEQGSPGVWSPIGGTANIDNSTTKTRELLDADKQLTLNSEYFQFLDPNAVNRIITLPACGETDYFECEIMNISDGTFSLLVKEVDTSEVINLDTVTGCRSAAIVWSGQEFIVWETGYYA